MSINRFEDEIWMIFLCHTTFGFTKNHLLLLKREEE